MKNWTLFGQLNGIGFEFSCLFFFVPFEVKLSHTKWIFIKVQYEFFCYCWYSMGRIALKKDIKQTTNGQQFFFWTQIKFIRINISTHLKLGRNKCIKINFQRIMNAERKKYWLFVVSSLVKRFQCSTAKKTRWIKNLFTINLHFFYSSLLYD